MNIRKIRLEKMGPETILSPLESKILKILWSRKKGKVKEIHKIMGKKGKGIALSSVAVSLDRLYKKGIVERKIETGTRGPRYIYYPIYTRKDFEKSLIDETVNKLINIFGGVAVSYFNERFGKASKGRRKK